MFFENSVKRFSFESLFSRKTMRRYLNRRDVLTFNMYWILNSRRKKNAKQVKNIFSPQCWWYQQQIVFCNFSTNKIPLSPHSVIPFNIFTIPYKCYPSKQNSIIWHKGDNNRPNLDTISMKLNPSSLTINRQCLIPNRIQYSTCCRIYISKWNACLWLRW